MISQNLKKFLKTKEIENLRPEWSDMDEANWKPEYESIMKKYMETDEDDLKTRKKYAQQLINLKYENKLWVFNDMQLLEKQRRIMSKQILNLKEMLENLVAAVEKTGIDVDNI